VSIYYQDDLVTLYQGDCLELTDWVNADVLVTDPPYGMAYKDRQGTTIFGDNSLQARQSALALWGQKPALMFGTWKIARPESTKQVLVWDKWGGGGTVGQTTSPWAYSHEEIYVMGEWPKTIAGGRAREGGNPSKVSGVLRVANYNTQSSDRPDHPTPKPVSLMELLIDRTPHGIIADPFAGSGATLVAARNKGRQAIGVELEEKYCEIIANRLQQHTLFTF
jgi:DNA modification methylase